MTDTVAETIRALRAESNAAIAARDLDRITRLMLGSIVVSVAGGPRLTGREASRQAFADQFADRSFRGYVREPESITVHQPPVGATESGRWAGHWQAGLRKEEMRGAYVAEWRLTDDGWRIASEVFVSMPG